MEPPAPSGLGPIHGAIGASDQRIRRFLLSVGDRDADARAHIERIVTGTDGRLQHLQHLFRDLHGVFGPGEGFEQQTELVAAIPGQGIAVAHLRRQSQGDGLEKAVSGEMAQGVVDALEMIEIDEQQSEPFSGAPGTGQCVRQAFHEMGPIGQAGQEIGGGQATECACLLVEPHEAHERVTSVTGARCLYQHRNPAAFAVAAVQPPVPGRHGRCVVVIDQSDRPKLTAQYRFAGVSGHPDERRIDRQDPASGIEQKDAVRELSEQKPCCLGIRIVHAGAGRLVACHFHTSGLQEPDASCPQV